MHFLIGKFYMVNSKIDFKLHQPMVKVFGGSMEEVGFGDNDDLAGISSHDDVFEPCQLVVG